MIRKLKTNEKEIMNELSKIMNNEKLLKNQSYLKLINTNPNNIVVDKRKLEAEIKALNENKNYYMIRLDEIKTRIKSLEYKYELEQGIYENDRQEKLQKFFEKQNRIINENNDESNLKIKKLQIENRKLLTNMQNDAENRLKKKIDEFEKNKEKEAQNKIILMNKMREEERKEIIKRKNKANEETVKLKEYMNKKPDIKKYLYQKINNTFNDKLNKRLLKENNKRKLFMKPMENDIQNMLKNYEEFKKKKSLELEEKTQKLKKSWSERNLLIPTYKTQLRQMIDIEQQNLRYEKVHEKEKKKEMKNIQMKYSKKIENQHNFNMKNISNSEEYIIRAKNMSKPHYFINNINNYCDIIREKIFLRNNNKSQDNINPLLSNNDKDIKDENKNKDLNISEKNKPNNIKLPSLDQNKIKNLKNYTIGKNIILNQNKNIKTVSNAKVGRNIPNINKTKKSQTLEVENINYKGTKEIQKLIEKNGLNKNTFEIANCKLESLNERQKQKSLLLKHEGGFIKNPGLGDEVCDILIDSMTAKLSLINEIDKIQNNKNKPLLVDVGTGPGGEGLKNLSGSNKNKNKYGQQLSEEDEQNDYSSINKEGEGEDEGVDE